MRSERDFPGSGDPSQTFQAGGNAQVIKFIVSTSRVACRRDRLSNRDVSWSSGSGEFQSPPTRKGPLTWSRNDLREARMAELTWEPKPEEDLKVKTHNRKVRS